MDSNAAAGLAGLSMMASLFFVILGILWILVPFAIFGIKPLLKDLIQQQERTHKLLEAGLVAREAAVAPAPVPTRPPDNRTLGEIMADRQS